MILTLTPNPALDLTWHVDRLEPGSSHRVGTGAHRAGGKGLNVSRVLHALGYETLALTTAGGASGDEFADELRASGIPHRLIPAERPTRRSIAVVDESDGEATLLNERGEGLSAAEVSRLVGDATTLGAEADVVAICGSLPPGIEPGEIAMLIGTLRIGGVPVIVDTSGPGLIAAARAGATALKPNRDELAEATGIADPIDGARALVSEGAHLVIVSLGTEGLAIVTANQVVRARPARVLRGNATGAGDAAVAAMCTVFAEGTIAAGEEPAADALEVLARRAVAWSAAAVLMPLAGEISPVYRELEDEVVIGHTTPTPAAAAPKDSA